MYNKGKQLTTSLFIYGSEYEYKCAFFYYLGGPGGPSMIMLCLSCFPGILSPIAINKEAIWQELLKFKYKIWKSVIFVYFEGPYVEPRGTKIAGQQDLITEQPYMYV